MITDYHWIDDNSELEQLILSVNNSDALPFDSEFERVNTFYPKPALFQLKIKDDYYLIDMKKISNYEPLKKLLNNIILHSGSEDLEILNNLNNQLPQHIFDTQIAASLCGYGLHYSYQNIVKDFFAVELSKAHSRSDWMKRPLSDEQIEYAIDDVVYLSELKEQLQGKLQQQGRTSWYYLLMNQRKSAIINSNHINKTFINICKSKRFKAPQQKLVYALLNWREETAKDRNKPRTWILKNTEIIDIDINKPLNEQALIKSIGLYPKFVKYNSKALLGLYEKAEELKEDSLPQYDKLSSEQGALFNELKIKLADKCESLAIPASLVVNVSDLKSLVASGKTLEDLELWQLINQ
jgi:ribonuclease D